MGNNIIEAVSHLPFYDLEMCQTSFSEIAKIEIKIQMKNSDKIREKCTLNVNSIMYLIVGDTQNNVLHFSKLQYVPLFFK